MTKVKTTEQFIEKPDDEAIRTYLESLVTTRVLCERFNVTAMTLYVWRRDLGLPCVIIPGDDRDTIRYDWDAVKRWANENGKRYREP